MGETHFSLDAIYQRYHKNVYNYIAFRINHHHDAEELASDVFVKAMKAQARYNPALPMEAWLIGIAKNIVTDHLRKTLRRKILPLDSLWAAAASETPPEDVAINNEECQQLLLSLAKLRAKERQILAMKFATELKHSEIAALLKISESHVGVTAHRAINKLKKYMEAETA